MQVIFQAFDPADVVVYDKSYPGVLPEKQFHFPGIKTFDSKGKMRSLP